MINRNNPNKYVLMLRVIQQKKEKKRETGYEWQPIIIYRGAEHESWTKPEKVTKIRYGDIGEEWGKQLAQRLRSGTWLLLVVWQIGQSTWENFRGGQSKIILGRACKGS